jgi:hypothetical protein
MSKRGGIQQRRLQRFPGSLVCALSGRTGQQVDRLTESPAQRQRLGQRQRDLAAPRPVPGASQRLTQMAGSGGGRWHGLELAKAEQNIRPHRR